MARYADQLLAPAAGYGFRNNFFFFAFEGKNAKEERKSSSGAVLFGPVGEKWEMRKKSRIRETLTLSTFADSSTDTIKKHYLGGGTFLVFF